MIELRSKSPYQVGRGDAIRNAERTIDEVRTGKRRKAGNPTESELIYAEALRRIGDELPLFNGQYDDGFTAGWQDAFWDSTFDYNERRKMIERTGMHDFEEGRFFNPARYGFEDQEGKTIRRGSFKHLYTIEENIAAYRDGWQAAEQAATPVSGSIFEKDEDLKGGK